MEQTKLEKYLEDYLVQELGNEKGKDYYAYYQIARNYLYTDVVPNIKATEPNLTDHSSKHIENVLNNVWRLLDDKLNKLTCYDLYILCLSVLFHDVGNINGRKEHNKKVLDVYNCVRNNDAKFHSERLLILKTTQAHCGKTNSGSRDTLKNVDIKGSLSGEPIQLREIASILRFADELAEGPQRTSDYLFIANKISNDSKKYHRYAQITEPFIDRGNERIVLQYHIDVKEETVETLRELLTFIYERILKLNEERVYTKFHSKLLSPFRKTEVTFNFNNNGEPILRTDSNGKLTEIISDKIILPDKCTIPGDKQPCATDLASQFSELNIDNIINQLKLTK